MKRYRFFSVLCAIGLVFSIRVAPAVHAADTDEAPIVKVMTYNLRYATTGDGEHFWGHRRGAAEAVVKEYAPDLMGIQEGLLSQLLDLDKVLTDYDRVGVDRSGKGTDEHTVVYYRKDRFALLETETLWLSDTPKVPGSKSWGNNLPRILTWARFQEKSSGNELVMINVHLDHQSEPARQESMKMIVDLVRERFAGQSVVLTGDFNSPGSTGAVHAIAVSKDAPEQRIFLDAWEEAAVKEGPEGTFHGFRGVPGSARIDWILGTPQFTPLLAKTISDQYDGHWPSDHFPVFAKFRWAPASKP
ncbi:MAG: endonuclease/exonuclease/phosphatase family protein [Verrucomicrobiota bacterium]|jgi:endonuclease/exonuclease/phosphatase family metal-dependent hydrolase|nr:endonuclease/exonuclease/phosphatase family protein [Verrucomicrobiota bacterium]